MASSAWGRWRRPAREDPDLINAGKGYVTLVPGGSLFDHALSFTMIRGGHITHAVIGAIEVAANGDLANWRVPGQKVPGVGGAMDIAFGVHNVYVAMNHVTNKGEPKILNACTCPLTAPALRRRIYTDMARDRCDARRPGAARSGARARSGRRPSQDRGAVARRGRLPRDGRARRLQRRSIDVA